MSSWQKSRNTKNNPQFMKVIHSKQNNGSQDQRN